LSELDQLRQENAQLRKEKFAYQAQCEIFEDFISMARSPDEPEFIKSTLQKIIEISEKLTGAELGSLFLFDSDGVVVDSVLARGEVAPEIRSVLIGSVFRKGLAGWVVRNRTVGLVVDTTDDERWLILPDQPYSIRSALALPIISGQMLLGILTLMHSSPGHFKWEMAEVMKLAANQLALVLENAYLFANLDDSFKSLGEAKKKIESYSRALEKELDRGHRIQKDFLPRKLPSLPNWGITAYFQPARQVSGDFYDMFALPGDLYGIAIGDVCDKGVGSALFMALFRSLIRIFSGQTGLNQSTVEQHDPKIDGLREMTPKNHMGSTTALHTIVLTNDYIAQQHHQMCMFATLFFGVLDPDSGEICYVNAGHEPVFIIGPKGLKKTLRQTGPAAGLFAQMKFACKKTRLQPGDQLFAYTDGIIDARSQTGERFDKQRLVSLLSQPAATDSELLERVKSRLDDHIADTPLEDDITMLILQRKQ
jgi:sigma-B regulation protein RsbU (phosphoserine phosphatase)